jgi:hypothetical protein
MLFLHETHEIIPAKGAEFAAAYRDGWMQALAKGTDARLLWYWEQAVGTSHSGGVITITAVKDGAALERLLGRLENGDLAPWLRSVDELRYNVTGQVLLATEWSETDEFDLTTVPTGAEDWHSTGLYGYDVVWPPSLDNYIREAGRHWYKPLTDGTAKIRINIAMPGFFQVGEGTGRRPEVHLVQKRLEPTTNIVEKMLGSDYRPQDKNPDTWFMRGLAVRDQWESRMLRYARWSPRE